MLLLSRRAFQTDVTGVYNRERGAPPRLRGYMKTDAEGRFTTTPGAAARLDPDAAA
jgi:hypothetical protein